ncbi:MAG: hypothetical protein LBU46_08490, partial [Candidatus Accumulibacter sp.]|nr:hypothetical protein [Accumulibacter sp.]
MTLNLLVLPPITGEIMNIALTISIGVPILFFLMPTSTGEITISTAFYSSSMVSCVIPSVCGFYLAGALRHTQVLRQATSPLKGHAIKDAKTRYFRNIWFISNGHIIPVSDTAWIAAAKKYGVT